VVSQMPPGCLQFMASEVVLVRNCGIEVLKFPSESLHLGGVLLPCNL